MWPKSRYAGKMGTHYLLLNRILDKRANERPSHGEERRGDTWYTFERSDRQVFCTTSPQQAARPVWRSSPAPWSTLKCPRRTKSGRNRFSNVSFEFLASGPASSLAPPSASRHGHSRDSSSTGVTQTHSSSCPSRKRETSRFRRLA